MDEGCRIQGRALSCKSFSGEMQWWSLGLWSMKVFKKIGYKESAGNNLILGHTKGHATESWCISSPTTLKGSVGTAQGACRTLVKESAETVFRLEP